MARTVCNRGERRSRRISCRAPHISKGTVAADVSVGDIAGHDSSQVQARGAHSHSVQAFLMRDYLD
jgi:hypothetical protein